MRVRRLVQVVLLVLGLIGLSLAVVQTANAGKPGGGGGGGSPSGLNIKLSAYDRLSKSWTPGNTAGYAEAEVIPFRIAFTGTGTVGSLQVLGDHLNGGVPGFSEMENFQICTGAPTTTLPGATGCQLLPVGDPGTGQPYVTHDPNVTTAGVVQLSWTFHDVDVPADGVVLLFGGELAIGSHNYPGSSLHMAIGAGTSVTGADVSYGGKNVPIPVNSIIATETDKKINGQDAFVGKVGDVVTVTIASELFGHSKGTQDITIRDDIPTCLDYVEGSAVPAATQLPGAGPNGVISWSFTGVKNDTTRTVSFRATVVSVGTCENVATTTSNVAPDSTDTVPITSAGVPDLKTMKDCTDQVAPGGEATCTISWENKGSGTATGATVKDVLDAGLTYVQVAGQPVPTSIVTDPQTGKTTISWQIGDVAAGESGSITYRERVPATGPAGAQQFADTATVFSPGDPGEPTTEIVTVTYAVDLAITKSCPTSVQAGQKAPYTLTYRNTGTAAATGVTIVDTLPAGMTFSDASVTPTSVSGNGRVVTWSIGNVAAMSGPFTITLRADVSGTGPFTNSATISSGQTDANAADNTSSCTSGLDYTDIFVSKDCGSAFANPGDLLTHTIAFGNLGNVAATSVVVTDTLGAGLTLEGTPTVSTTGGAPQPSYSRNGQVLTWTFASLPAGSGGTITYTVRVAATWDSSGPRDLGDSAAITGTPADTSDRQGNNSSACSTRVDFQPRLVLEKSGCRLTVVPGGLQTYALAWRNEGSAPATGVTLVDTPPANQPITSAPGATVSGNTATWDLGQVDPGEQGTESLTVRVDAASGTVVTNTATLDGTNATATSDGATTTVSDAGAATKADAYALEVGALGLQLIDRNLSRSASAAPGGPASSTSGLVHIPDLLGVVEGDLMATTSQSEIGIGEARSTSTTTVAGLKLLGGLITSATVRGVTHSVAGPQGAESSTLGSTFESLRINGQPWPANVPPNTDASVAGLAEIKLNVATKSASFANGRFTTSADVDMIRVKVLGLGLGLPVGAIVVVGHSHSEATYPTGLACGAQPNTVSGRAFTAHVNLAAGLADVTVNEAEIAPLGGTDSADGAVASVPGVLSAGVVTNDTSGTIGNPPTSWATSTAADVNLLNGLVTATALSVRADSTANGTTAKTTFLTEFLGLRINGQAISLPVGPNTVIDIPQAGGGLAHIVLNEQSKIDGTTDTSGTVNAIHVQLFNAVKELTTDVVVVSAHSDAHKGS